MHSLIASAIVVAIVMAGHGSVTAHYGARPDVGGTWTLVLTFDKGKDTLVLTVAQDKDEVAGQLASKAFGQRSVTGRVAEGRITLQVEAERHGKPTTLAFTGRLDGAKAMSGTATWSGEKAAFGRWTATKSR